MTKKVLLLPGDGIGPEIVAEARRVLECLRDNGGLDIELDEGLIGGAAYDATGNPLPDETVEKARASDAVLMGSVGGPQWDNVERDLRPERGLLRIRKELDLFSNLRPGILFPQLANASTLKPSVVSGLDIMIVRELTGGLYFGQPRGIRTLENGEREGFNTMHYSESQIRRIGVMAFEIAMKRDKRLVSVEKANVLEVSELWREVMEEVAKDYPEVSLTHMYVDNAAMQLIRDPKQFDVMVTENMFGDILSDATAMLTGSIGMLPSASINGSGVGLYEPVHGSAPDIAGRGIANPLATILSASMMLRYSLNEAEAADHIDAAVAEVLERGLRTADIASDISGAPASTSEMAGAIVDVLTAHCAIAKG